MRSFLITCLAFFACTLGARAHPNLQDAMWVRFEPTLVHVAVNVSVKEIIVAQDVTSSKDGGADTATLSLAAEKHRDYLLQHLKVSAGSKVLTGKIVKLTPPPFFGEAEETFYQYEIEYPLNGAQPREVVFSQDMLKEWPYAIGTPWNVSYVVRTKRPDSDEVSSWLLPLDKPATFPTGWKEDQRANGPAAESEIGRTFREYLWHGVMHILTGYDHLLFVSALVIATLSFWEMVKVIAAFTLAHTITLALSVFDIFRLPSFIVEPVIALSIVFVALENVFRPQRSHSRFRLAVAFGFGLIHGLGFAGGLLDAMSGLPSTGIWIALGAFSLGVEIGHQVVVLPLFGLLALSRRKMPGRFYSLTLRYGSVTISCCGAYYLVVALHEQVFSR
jgi:hypothetical protein